MPNAEDLTMATKIFSTEATDTLTCIDDHNQAWLTGMMQWRMSPVPDRQFRDPQGSSLSQRLDADSEFSGGQFRMPYFAKRQQSWGAGHGRSFFMSAAHSSTVSVMDCITSRASSENSAIVAAS
jgi:hypothetical protein